MFKNFVLLFIGLAYINFNFFAQPAQVERNKDTYNWMFGLGWNIVSPLKDLGLVKGVSYPSRFFVDKHYYRNWSFEGSLAFGTFDTISERQNSDQVNTSFFSLDANFRYSLQNTINGFASIDPYFTYGIGLTSRSIFGTHINGNAAIGFNFWFSSNLGIQAQSALKIAFTSDLLKLDKHYLQHTIGLVARIPDGSITDNNFNKRRYKKIKIIREKKKKKKEKSKESEDL